MADRPQVFLASRNPKKIDEMRRILDEHLPGIVVLGLDDVTAYDEPVEDQPTFEGNALLNAEAGVRATGLPSLADDSGLCVDALNGMWGVFSARWSGPPKDDHRNNLLLLDQLADVPTAPGCGVPLRRGVLPPERSTAGNDGRDQGPDHLRAAR